MTATTSAAPQLHGEDVAAGDELPPLTVTIGPAQMFLFSAAVHNPHRIHYDRDWAVEVEGHPGLVVQGHLQSALLARAVTGWMGSSGRLLRFAVRNRGAAHAGETLTFTGTVTAAEPGEGGHRVELDLRGLNAGGSVILPGSATVLLPSRGGG